MTSDLLLRLLVAGCLTLGACSDRLSSDYATFDQAREQGGVGRGWIPEYLPPSSVEIREVHDLDTNEMWCTFEFAREEVATLHSRLKPVSAAQVTGLTIRSPGKGDWWPDCLLGSLTTESLARWDRLLYDEGRPLLFFFIDLKGGRGFCHGPASSWREGTASAPERE